jgi:hypothetical protein
MLKGFIDNKPDKPQAVLDSQTLKEISEGGTEGLTAINDQSNLHKFDKRRFTF